MARSAIFTSYGQSGSVNTGALGGAENTATTELTREYLARIAGTFQLLGAQIDNLGTTRSVLFRKGAANGNQVVSMGSTTAGWFEDTSHTDTVTAGDLINYSLVNTTASFLSLIRSVFAAASNVVTFLISSTQFGLTTSRFVTPNSYPGSGSATEAAVKLRLRAPGTLKNLFVRVSANTRTAATTVRVRKNGADGNCNLSIASGTTGTFEDTSSTDTIAAGDDVCHSVGIASGSGTCTFQMFGCNVVNSTNNKFDMASSAYLTNTRAASATASPLPLNGYIFAAFNTEALCKGRLGFHANLTDIRIVLSANTYSVAATLKSRVNGADGNLAATLGAGLTGEFADTTHMDEVQAGDDLNLTIVGGTSGSITFVSVGSTAAEIIPPASAGRRTLSPLGTRTGRRQLQRAA